MEIWIFNFIQCTYSFCALNCDSIVSMKRSSLSRVTIERTATVATKCTWTSAITYSDPLQMDLCVDGGGPGASWECTWPGRWWKRGRVSLVPSQVVIGSDFDWGSSSRANVYLLGVCLFTQHLTSKLKYTKSSSLEKLQVSYSPKGKRENFGHNQSKWSTFFSKTYQRRKCSYSVSGSELN